MPAHARNAPAGPGRIVWSMAEIAEVMGWEVRRVRRWLLREGAVRRQGRHWYTSKSQLRRAFGADVAAEVIANLPE